MHLHNFVWLLKEVVGTTPWKWILLLYVARLRVCQNADQTTWGAGWKGYTRLNLLKRTKKDKFKNEQNLTKQPNNQNESKPHWKLLMIKKKSGRWQVKRTNFQTDETPPNQPKEHCKRRNKTEKETNERKWVYWDIKYIVLVQTNCQVCIEQHQGPTLATK